MFLENKDHYLFMQRERHETEILKRIQPGLVFLKTSLCEQKNGSNNPVTRND